MKFLRIVDTNKTEYLYNPETIHIVYLPKTQTLRVITPPNSTHNFTIKPPQYEELLDILEASRQDDVSTFDLNEWDEVENEN